jgi:hypothetical protein
MPKHFEMMAKDLIKKLLVKNVPHRIGSSKNGASQGGSNTQERGGARWACEATSGPSGQEDLLLLAPLRSGAWLSKCSAVGGGLLRLWAVAAARCASGADCALCWSSL